MASVTTSTRISYRNKLVKQKINLKDNVLGECMTEKKLIEPARILTTSNQSALGEQQQQATRVYEVNVPTSLITGKQRLQGSSRPPYDRAEIPPTVLRDLWITKFGVDWVDAVDVGNDYEPVKQQLWYAGMLEKLFRPDIGRETWRVFNADT